MRHYLSYFSSFIVRDHEGVRPGSPFVLESLYRAFHLGLAADMDSHRDDGRPHVMTAIHTNLPRGGATGLPAGYSFDIARVTLLSDRRVKDMAPILEASTACLRIRQRDAFWLRLSQATFTEGFTATQKLAANEPFWVEVLMPFFDLPPGTPTPGMAAPVPIAGEFQRLALRAREAVPSGDAYSYERNRWDRVVAAAKDHVTKPLETTFWFVFEGHGTTV